jgi:hypothetical protein
MFVTSKQAVSAIFLLKKLSSTKKLKTRLLQVDAFSFTKLIQRMSWALMEGAEKIWQAFEKNYDIC